ncbi:hypothetical protein, partial [Bacteroides sp. AF27-33]|uniref:hypothetical protein n=2 Tax=Bacteroides TaxID=816 RepID=UPI001F1F991B
KNIRMKKGRQDRIAETLTSFSANSKGEEALLHLQNTYSQVIQKKDEGVDKKCFLYIENAA